MRSWIPTQTFANKQAKRDAEIIAEKYDKMTPKERAIYRDSVLVSRDQDGNVYGVSEKEAPAPGPVIKNYFPTPGQGGGGSGTLGKFKDSEYERYYSAGQTSDSLPQRLRGYRVSPQARADWDAGYNDWLSRKGKSGAVAGMEKAEVKATQEELKLLQKGYGAMQTFVGNMDQQIKRIEQLAKMMPSSDRARIFALPANEALRIIKGDPNLSKYRMYLTNIATEAGKLASGSPQSVAQLSEGARLHWDKIHDPNLPLSAQLDLLKETQKDGNFRLKSQKDGIADAKRRLVELGGGKTPETDMTPETKQQLEDLMVHAKSLFKDDKAKARKWYKAKAKALYGIEVN